MAAQEPQGRNLQSEDAHQDSNMSRQDPTLDSPSSSMTGKVDADIRLPWYRRIRWWGWCLIAVLAVVLGTVGTFAVQALQIKHHEEQAIAIAKRAVSGGDVTSLPRQLPRMQEETRAARDIAHNGLWNAAASMPGLGVNIKALQGMTDVVNDAMNTTVPQYAQAAAPLLDGGMLDDDAIDVAPIVDALPELVKAGDSLRALQSSYDAIPEPNIGVVRDVFDMGRYLLNQGVLYADLMEMQIPHLPTYLGYEGTQTYAILAMTPAEARAAGGLIGAVGTVTLDKGKISIGDFVSNAEYSKWGTVSLSQDEERIYQDESAQKSTFDLRDISNFPDTQRTAEAFRTLWKRNPANKDQPLSGVVMVDTVFVQSLVKSLGNVTLPDGRVLTGSNTAEFLSNTVYKDYSPEETDKYFGIVASTCIERLMGDLNTGRLLSVAKEMRAMAKYRHVSAYSFNADLEPVLWMFGFTHELTQNEERPTLGIYLTEQNASKMDWYIKRSTKIEPTDCRRTGSRTYHVEYTLTNTLTKDEARALPSYITGTVPITQGSAYEIMLFAPPAGGTISNFEVTGNGVAPVADYLNYRLVYRALTQIQPDSTVTYSFDVTTSPLATQDLTIDETPTGQERPDVTYVRQCPIE